MAPQNRRVLAWFGVLFVVAAGAIVALQSCGTDEPMASDSLASRRADAAGASDSTPPRKPPARRRAAADETASSGATDAARADDAKSPPSAASAPKTEPQMFEVRILRADGTPAAGARLDLNPRSLWNDWPSRPWAVRLQPPDADGRARLGRSAAVPYVRFGSDVGWSYKPGSVTPLPDVVLKPGVVVRGRTIDSDLVAVDGATVRAEMTPPGAGGTIVVETTSDGDGAFELPPLPFDESGNGRQEIEVVAYAENLVPASVTTTRTDAPKGPVVLTLYRGAALRGRIVGSDWKALSSVRVLLVGTHIAAFPDADGRFVLRLPRDGGEVIVHDGMTGTSMSVFRPSAGTYVAARRLGAFRGDAGDRDLGDVVVDGGKPLRGVVALIDMKGDSHWHPDFRGVIALLNGDPVAGARVTAVLAGVQILSVTTDAKGAFELPLSGDEHDLVVNESSSNVISRTPAVEGVRGGGPDVRIARGRLGILLRLYDENGARLELLGVHAEAGLQLHGQTTGHSWASADDSSVPRHEIRVQLPTEGVHDAFVSAPGFEMVTIENVDVRADRDAEVDVRLRKNP